MQGEMKKQVPTFDKMLRPVVQALHELGGSAQREELDKRTIRLMELSEAVQRVPHKETGATTGQRWSTVSPGRALT